MLQDAFELLSARRYKRVEQLLHEQQEGALQSGQMAMVVILAAACQLCLTCRQYRADRELHRLSLDEATRRERDARLQIQTVLTMLSQLASLQTQTQTTTVPDHVSTRVETARPEKTGDKQPTLMQKVRHLLGFEQAVPSDQPAAGVDLAAEEIKAPPPDRQAFAAPLRHSAEGQEDREETSTSPLGDQNLLQAVAALLTGPSPQEAEVVTAQAAELLAVETEPGPTPPTEERVSQELSESSLTQASPPMATTELDSTVVTVRRAYFQRRTSSRQRRSSYHLGSTPN